LGVLLHQGPHIGQSFPRNHHGVRLPFSKKNPLVIPPGRQTPLPIHRRGFQGIPAISASTS
jgi:hypothetical protein